VTDPSATTRAGSPGRYAGVSGEVSFVDTPDGPIVVKRALPKLKVAADWFASPERSAVEAACLQVIAEVLGQQCAPRVLWVDRQSHVFAMERLPERLVPWKARLLACDVDRATARRVGHLLGQLHTRTRGRADLAAEFHDRTHLQTLRVRPYHERVAERRPDLAEPIRSVIDNMLATRECLVHGDYSPKNLLTDGQHVVILDCEVAHWGDPRFDIAFCLCHLLLKIVHSKSCPDELARSAEAYLAAYASAGLPVVDLELARATGCLVLARVIGDSPVDYLDSAELRASAVRLGESLLLTPVMADGYVGRALESRPRC
jgi:aminoglycoside phosphotransferase (APT) family kinase protein